MEIKESNNKKNWSGERIETFVVRDTSIEHLHRYAVAMKYAKDRVVLDIACGEGYGSKFLSAVAKSVIGIDIDPETIFRASKKYLNHNLSFKQGNVTAIPENDGTFDLVVSFETLEHLEEHDCMLSELKRVLKKDGILIISSPEKKEYSDKRNYKNPFHKKELYEGELVSLLKKYFISIELLYQRTIKGSAICGKSNYTGIDLLDGDFNQIKELEFIPKFIIAIAANNSNGLNNQNGIFSFFDAEMVIHTQQEDWIQHISTQSRENAVRWIKDSWSFKIGSFITFPLRALKKLFAR